MNHRDPDWLVGRRFVADLRVVSIGAPPPLPSMPYMLSAKAQMRAQAERERRVVLHMHGDRYEISLGELMQLIESGFVVEAATP